MAPYFFHLKVKTKATSQIRSSLLNFVWLPEWNFEIVIEPLIV